MENGKDYLYFPTIKMMSSIAPLTQIDGVLIGTPNFVFLIPWQSSTNYLFVATFKTHRFFVNSNVAEGCANLISEAQSVQELENSFIHLLEDDPKYVHKLDSKEWFRLNKWFKTYNFRFGKGKLSWSAFIVKGHDAGKAIRAFYSGRIK
ncbi:MAG: hypothetical protein MUC87_01475 [Bacteroidia bacterium]|jgi:hypothetical protein|nr:hypothetical protein [Bacteroidia bacterium]